MPTYDTLLTGTLGSNASSWYIGAIPQTHTDFEFHLQAKLNDSANREFFMWFNNTTQSGTVGSYINFRGNSASANLNSGASQAGTFSQTAANSSAGNHIVYMTNYSSTSLTKNWHSTNFFSESFLFGAGQWPVTSAITSIGLSVNANAIAAGSKFTLYGINKT
jgi:hypothetical protein